MPRFLSCTAAWLHLPLLVEIEATSIELLHVKLFCIQEQKLGSVAITSSSIFEKKRMLASSRISFTEEVPLAESTGSFDQENFQSSLDDT